jgi:pimeloyl-ACP methyl ester carboxylesterase
MTVSLVLLPGLDGTGSLFEPLLKELPDELEPIVVSYPAQKFLEYAALRDLALRHVPAGRPFVLLGESFSGPVAVLAAALRPEGLLGVVLCASFVSAPRPWAKFALPLLQLLPIHVAARMVGRYMLMGRFKAAGVFDSMLAALSSVPEKVLRARLAAAANIDVSAELGAIAVPSLYLQASEDLVVPKAAAEAFLRAAARGNVAVVTGPHFLLQCVPSDAAECVVRFIERLPWGV